jgi:translation initiation factor 5A
MEKTVSTIKNLKPGSFVIIDDAPCKVEKVEVSKTGKHGSSKARVEAMGMLDGRRRSLIGPADEDVEVPILLKKKAQVLAIVGDKAQLMDMETYEVFELDIPEEMKGQVKAGTEMNYFDVVGIKTLKQLK